MVDSFSLAWAAQPLALEADKDDFGQSLVVWPTPLQNMHKLLSKWRSRSCRVSFLSLLSFSGREVELLEDDCSLPDLLPLFWLPLFFLELFRLLLPEVRFLPFSSDLPESSLLLSGCSCWTETSHGVIPSVGSQWNAREPSWPQESGVCLVGP